MSANAKHDRPDLLKIGDFARLAGTNLRTLRYYEELGLLHPTERSRGGFRYYRATDVNRMRVIGGLQELGLTLEEIRDLLATRDQGQSRQEYLDRVRAALEAQRDLYTARIAELNQRREQASDALAKLDECATCDHTPELDNNYCEPCHLTSRHLPTDLSALF